MRTMTRGTVLGAAVSASMLMVLAGCSNTPKEGVEVEAPMARAFEAPPAWNAGDRPVSRALVMGARGGEAGPELVSRQKLEAAWSPAGAEGVVTGDAGERLTVRYAANGAQAEEVIRVLAGDFLGMSYALDPAIKNAGQLVTMSIDEEMTRGGVRDLLGGLATIYGWMIEERDGVLIFHARGGGRGQAGAGGGMAGFASTPILRAQAAFESDTPAVRIVRPDHVDASTLVSGAETFLSAGGAAIASGRTLLIVDTVRNTNRIARILEALDVPAFEGVEIHTYRLAHRAPAEAASLLTSIASATTGDGQAAGISFVAVPGTREVMVIARDASLLNMARDLIGTIDRPSGSDGLSVFHYKVQHYDPTELVRMLREVFGDRIEADRAGGTRPGSPDDGEARMRLVLDAPNRNLLVRATPEDYADLLSVIGALDRSSMQVMLNAVIAEVTLTDDLEFGIEYFINGLIENDSTVGDLSLTPGTTPGGAPLFAGVPSATLSILNSDFTSILRAVQTVTDMDVLSQPSVVVRDKADVQFQVGGEVPVVTGDLNSNAGTSNDTQIRRSIEYRETGIILTVTPHISETGEIRLEIDQEINEVGNTTELDTPEFITRALQTEVIVPHGQTILLAGLIETDRTKSQRKVPLLGDLPIIGAAFTSFNEEEVKRELFLAITPTIVSNPRQAQGTLGSFFDAAEKMRAAIHGHQDELPRGILHSETLSVPLGGWGEAPADAVPVEGEGGESPERPELERLIDPASDEAEDESAGAAQVVGASYYADPGD
ncbi:MAG: hypothetical protein Tsb0013_04370 [Phycisphaerales bacterium]